MTTIILVMLGVLVAGAVTAVLVVRALTEICQPNEVLVFSGNTRTLGGRRVPYRLVHGGRAMRVPLIEKVDRLNLTNMVIDLSVKGAYSKGGIALNVQGVANVKIASEEPTIGNAIERFLGVGRDAVARVAKETLEGNLRGVLATLTPEEVNQDRIKFAESLLAEADHDLRRLGLVLDMLKIQHVSDDVGYLDSLGRRQSAELQMRSRIAEANNQALARIRAAENLETQEKTQVEAAMKVADAEADRRMREARTRQAAVVAEARAGVTAAVARAEAEVAVQTARLEQVRLRLVADVVRPAEARRDRLVAEARGAAARLVEEGRATAEGVRRMAATCKAVGAAEARRIVLGQKLPGLVGAMLDTVGAVRVDRMTVVGEAGAGKLAAATAATTEQVRQGLGIDLGGLAERLLGHAGAPPALAGPRLAPDAARD
jgi:flotillin